MPPATSTSCARERRQQRTSKGSIRKFSPTGTPIPFTKSAPYISGNEINRGPGSNQNTRVLPEAKEQFGCSDYIDVDKSSARPGIHLCRGLPAPAASAAASRAVDVFAPSGEYVTSIRVRLQDGQAWRRRRRPERLRLRDDLVGLLSRRPRIEILTRSTSTRSNAGTPAATHRTPWAKPIYSAPCCTRSRSTTRAPPGPPSATPSSTLASPIGKVEADQFTTDLIPGPKDPNLMSADTVAVPAGNVRNVPGDGMPRTPDARRGVLPLSLRAISKAQRMRLRPADQDQQRPLSPRRRTPLSATGSRHTARACRETRCTRTGPPSARGRSPSDFEDGRHGLEVDPSGEIYVAASGKDKIVRFARGADAADRHHHTGRDLRHRPRRSLLRGIVDPDGGSADHRLRSRDQAARHAAAGNGHDRRRRPLQREHAVPEAPAEGRDRDGDRARGRTPLPLPLRSGKLRGREPRRRTRLRSEGGPRPRNQGRPDGEIEKNQVKLEGQLEPRQPGHRILVRIRSRQDLRAADRRKCRSPVPGIKPTPLVLGHLQAGKTYHFRLAASNAEYGTTHGQDMVVPYRLASGNHRRRRGKRPGNQRRHPPQDQSRRLRHHIRRSNTGPRVPTGTPSPARAKTSGRASNRSRGTSTWRTSPRTRRSTSASSRPTNGGPRRPTTPPSTSARPHARTRTSGS